jgi:hypothetical protein
MIVSLERSGQQHESHGARVAVARIANRRRRVRESDGVGTTLECGASKQLARLALELTVDPRLPGEQLVHFGPAAPANCRARRDEERRRRSF